MWSVFTKKLRTLTRYPFPTCTVTSVIKGSLEEKIQEKLTAGCCNTCIHLRRKILSDSGSGEFLFHQAAQKENRVSHSLPGASKEKSLRNIFCVLVHSWLQGYIAALYISLPEYGISVTRWYKCTVVRKSGKRTSLYNTVSAGTCVPSFKKIIKIGFWDRSMLAIFHVHRMWSLVCQDDMARRATKFANMAGWVDA